MAFDPTEEPGGWRCELRSAWHDLISLQFFKKVLYCSWAHKLVWTTTNKGERRQVGGHCMPHVWHDCRTWHCTECHPCGEGLEAFIKLQKPLDPDFADVINRSFWDLL